MMAVTRMHISRFQLKGLVFCEILLGSSASILGSAIRVLDRRLLDFGGLVGLRLLVGIRSF